MPCLRQVGWSLGDVLPRHGREGVDLPREKFHMGSVGRTWSPKKSPNFFDLIIISPLSVDQTWTFVPFFARVSIWQTERVAQRGGKG